MNINEVLNGNILKVWSKFVVASIVGVVLNTIYTMVDGIFVGQAVGEAALASINIVWPAVTVIIGIGLMIGVGTSSIMAIHMGKEERQDAQKVLGTCIASVLISGAALTILGLVFREPILQLLGATPDTINHARDYYTVFFIIAIPYMFSIALNPIVRTDGRPDLSMILIAIGAFANIVLDWLLVIKFDYGVKGAAIATSASIFISMVCSLYFFTKGTATIKIKREYFKIDICILKRILSIGFVSFASQLSYGIILLIQNNLMFTYGSTVDVAIFTVATYVNCFLVNTCMGISQGLQPLIGYHFGANKIKRMKKFLNITITICVVGGILVYIAILLFGKDIIQIFGVSSENLDFAYKKIIVYCLGNPVVGALFTMSGYYQAIGRNVYANVISIGRGFIFQCTFSLLLPPVIGVTGVFLSLPLAEYVTLGVLGIILIIEKNKKNRPKKLTLQLET